MGITQGTWISKRIRYLCLFLPICLLSLPVLAQSSKTNRKKPAARTASAVRKPVRKTSGPASQLAMEGATLQALAPVKALLEQKRTLSAKQAIDEVLANPRHQRSAEAWYLRAKVYAAIVAEPQTRSLVADGRRLALEAIRKSLETDRNQATLLLTLDAFQPAFSLYTSGFQQGVDLYNTERFDPALTAFRETGTTGDFIFSQGWGLSRLDTTLTLYTGLSAYRAGRQDEAMPHFRRLADADIGGAPEYASAYRFLTKYCYERKDAPGLARYLNTGLRLYPNDEYLMLLDIENTRDFRDNKSLFHKYEKFLSVFPDRYDAHMEYANELFGVTHTGLAARMSTDYAANCKRMEALFLGALRIRPESEEAWLSLGKHYYNEAVVLREESSRIEGRSSEDVQRRTGLSQESTACAEKAIVPLENLFRRLDGRRGLGAAESSYYQSACSLLSYCHEMKKDYVKSDMYRSRFEASRQTRTH